jgi:hypothetical protein
MSGTADSKERERQKRDSAGQGCSGKLWKKVEYLLAPGGKKKFQDRMWQQ